MGAPSVIVKVVDEYSAAVDAFRRVGACQEDEEPLDSPWGVTFRVDTAVVKS